MKARNTSRVLLILVIHIMLFAVTNYVMIRNMYDFVDYGTEPTSTEHIASAINSILCLPMSSILSRLLPKNSPSFFLPIFFLVNSFIWGLGVDMILNYVSRAFASMFPRRE